MNDRFGRRRFLVTGAGVAAGLLTGSASAAAEAIPPGLPPTKQQRPDVAIGWVRAVYDQVKAERFSPPAAARAYAAVAIAAYEAVVGGMPKHRSLGGQLNDLGPVPIERGHHWPIALNEAIAVTAQAVFADRSESSRTALADYGAATAAMLRVGVARPVADRAAAYGNRVGQHVAARMLRDNYLSTRGLPFTPPVGPDKWVRTPPNFGAPIEPHWGQIRSFALRANGECKPPPPVPYSEEADSPFWQQASVVYETSRDLNDARRTTALFWRDNPDGSTGLPSGHWMLVGCIVIEQEQLDLGRAVELLALLGIAVADGFTSCWTEKYETNLLRPVTYIQRLMDPAWSSFVNSPAFPEYTSGHSVGSAAAAEILTAILGTVAYTDDTGLVNGYPSVRYGSFREAANEAATSRLYGGIHYPMGIDAGLVQGADVARKVLERVQTRR